MGDKQQPDAKDWFIETLFPYPRGKGAPTVSKQLDRFRRTVRHVVMLVAEQYYGDDLLMHVYMAGVWHGAETQRRLVATGQLAGSQPKLI